MASVPFMPFLPSLPLPRLSYIHILRRQISSLPHLCQKATITVSKTPTPPPASPAVKPSAQVGLAALPPLPYHVHRTASQKLPIYHLAKRGGNLHQTRIRKIEGNVEKLREEIVAGLALKEETVVINRLTGHIIIKGWYKDNIKRFLEERHF
ncbi:hypothetical protein HO133_005111 [Letharia lupina]|uniref:Large ribosomal subunit protein mL49 n=1 Tax=Letharia lupina TaxID=560253 RepID=A0A8H6C9R6_9LECA|nr:uncharacterized protein HO133_005111 [Letharia lupina]KAF6219286.1 hypothetical protein HO133_005111 [Letharia lupina]